MFKALLKSRLLAYAMWFTGGSRTKKRSKGRSIGFALLMLYAFGCLAFLFGMYFSELAGPFSAAGIGWFYFALMGLAAFAVMFIFSAFMAKAQLFEAKDNELLLSMPIPPRLILASRMVSLLVYNLIFGLLVIVPALVVWLRVAPLPVMGVIAFLLVALGLPLLACACSSLLGWLLALITARVRRKSLVTTVFSLLFLAAYFYGYNKLMAVVQQLAVTGVQTAAQWRSAAPLYWLGDAIANGNVLHLLLTVLLCLAVFAVVYAVLSAFFLRITTTKHALAKIEYREKSLKVSGARQALLRREWKRLLSSSTPVSQSCSCWPEPSRSSFSARTCAPCCWRWARMVTPPPCSRRPQRCSSAACCCSPHRASRLKGAACGSCAARLSLAGRCCRQS